MIYITIGSWSDLLHYLVIVLGIVINAKKHLQLRLIIKFKR